VLGVAVVAVVAVVAAAACAASLGTSVHPVMGRLSCSAIQGHEDGSSNSSSNRDSCLAEGPSNF
jgi:hypothetical protein